MLFLFEYFISNSSISHPYLVCKCMFRISLILSLFYSFFSPYLFFRPCFGWGEAGESKIKEPGIQLSGDLKDMVLLWPPSCQQIYTE